MIDAGTYVEKRNKAAAVMASAFGSEFERGAIEGCEIGRCSGRRKGKGMLIGRTPGRGGQGQREVGGRVEKERPK